MLQKSQEKIPFNITLLEKVWQELQQYNTSYISWHLNYQFKLFAQSAQSAQPPQSTQPSLSTQSTQSTQPFGQFGFSWLKSFYPFKYNDQLVCSELKLNQTGRSYYFILSSHPFSVTGPSFLFSPHPANRHHDNGRSFYYALVDRAQETAQKNTNRHPRAEVAHQLQRSELETLILQLLMVSGKYLEKHRPQQSNPNGAEDLELPLVHYLKGFHQQIEKANKELKRDLAENPSFKEGQLIEAVLIANPAGDFDNADLKSSCSELPPSKTFIYKGDGFDITTTGDSPKRQARGRLISVPSTK